MLQCNVSTIIPLVGKLFILLSWNSPTRLFYRQNWHRSGTNFPKGWWLLRVFPICVGCAIAGSRRVQPRLPIAKWRKKHDDRIRHRRETQTVGPMSPLISIFICTNRRPQCLLTISNFLVPWVSSPFDSRESGICAGRGRCIMTPRIGKGAFKEYLFSNYKWFVS